MPERGGDAAHKPDVPRLALLVHLAAAAADEEIPSQSAASAQRRTLNCLAPPHSRPIEEEPHDPRRPDGRAQERRGRTSRRGRWHVAEDVREVRRPQTAALAPGPPEPKATGSNPVGRANSSGPFPPRKGPFSWGFAIFRPWPPPPRAGQIGSDMAPEHPFRAPKVSRKVSTSPATARRSSRGLPCLPEPGENRVGSHEPS